MIHTAVEAPGEAPSITMIERSAELTSSVPNSRMPFVRLCSGALLRGDGRESGNELVHAFAPAMRARCFGLFYVGDVMLLREFLVAVLAMIKVLRHDLLRRT